jgi:Ca2+-transporting ATPase
MQIFNELNNRRFDNKFNVFEGEPDTPGPLFSPAMPLSHRMLTSSPGVHRNKFFIVINIIVVALQVTIIFIGSRVFDVKDAGFDGL